MQIREFQYLFSHIGTDSDKYAMAIGLTSFFALWFFNSLRRASQPRCVLRTHTASRPAFLSPD